MSEGHEHVHAGQETEGLPERPRVLLFFDYACPFCYVDSRRFETLERELDFELVLVPFELRPGMDSPIDLVEQGTGHSSRVDEHLERIAEKEGFPYVQPRLLPNTHRAIVLAEIARDRGHAVHRLVHREIFAAYFAQGLDIDAEETLLEIGAEAGITEQEVRDAWDQGVYDERIHQFRHFALELGLDATPAALICNELLIGSRPVRVLRESLERCDSRMEAEREGVVAAARAEGDPRVAPAIAEEDASSAPKR